MIKMLNKLIRIIVSVMVLTLMLIMSIFIIKAFGLWAENLEKLILVTGVGFAIYYLFFTFLLKRVGQNIQQLISHKFVVWSNWAVAFICFLLAIFTGFLMWRNSYSHSDIIKFTSVYLSIACYCLGGLYGIYRSKY